MPSTPQPATEGRPASAFQRNMRRLLRDMHIPDWDPAFLSQYDPEQLAEICATADLNAVMIYCKSHVGLCNYPTVIGKQHGSLHGRDVLGELNTALRRRGIATCGYHSINFDNWAAETHPQWRQVDLGLGRDLHEHTRYGVCCPNNPEYREYELGLLTEVLTRYEFDALWLDMIWYLAVCGCDRCRARYRQEEGAEIPTTIDWTAAGASAPITNWAGSSDHSTMSTFSPPSSLRTACTREPRMPTQVPIGSMRLS